MIRVVLLALLALLALACYGQYPEDLRETENPKRLAKMVRRAWNENPVRFQEQHAGDRVQVQGYVQHISSIGKVSIANQPTRKASKRTLVCAMDRAQVLGLSRWDKVTVTGKITGIYEELDPFFGDRWHLELEDCRVVEHEPFRSDVDR